MFRHSLSRQHDAPVINDGYPVARRQRSRAAWRNALRPASSRATGSRFQPARAGTILGAMAPSSFEIRNRMAAVGWGFMVVWFAMLLAFTYIMGRDGPHPSQPPLLQQGVLALFWIVGITVAGHVLSKPITRLSVDAAGHATMLRRTPFGREVEAWPPGAIAAIEVREGKDDEGDPYWTTLLVARDGAERLIREGRDPDAQREMAARLRAALKLG